MPARFRLLTIVVLAVLGWPSLGSVAQAQPPAAVPPASATGRTDSLATGAPLVLRGDTLLVVPGPLASFTAAERAEGIARRLKLFARAGADSVVLVPGATSTQLKIRGVALMTVTDEDAAALGQPRAELAKDYAIKLRLALLRGEERTTLRAVLLGVLWFLLATAALVFLLKLLARLMPRVIAKVESWRDAKRPILRIQALELLSASQLAGLLLGALRILRLALVVLLSYVYLVLALSFFPWTAPLAGSIAGYVLSPLRSIWRAFLAFLPNLFFIAVIVVVTRYALKLIRLVFDALNRGHLTLSGFDRDWAAPTYSIVRFFVFALAAVVMFPYLPGSRSDAFKGISLFLGLLLSLGSTSAVANIIAGVMLTYTRAFKVGDRIQMGETMGDVIDKTLLVTRVRTPKNVDITVPNASVLSSHIVNYSARAQSGGLILHTSVTIGYDAPWKQVHELLVAAAKATPGILPEPAPFVLQTSLDDFFVSYEINGYTDQPTQMPGIYSALHANIQDAFAEAGVEIMSPHYASLRDGNASALPAPHQQKRGAAPAFRVRQLEDDAR